MNTQLQAALQKAWSTVEAPESPDGFAQVLTLAGFQNTDDDRDAAFDFLKRKDSGLDTNGFYPALALWEERKQATDRVQKAEFVRGQLGALREVLEEVGGQTEAGIDDLRKPAELVADTLDAIENVLHPPRVDTAALLTPTKRDEVIERVKAKPEALETSWTFPTAGEPEPLRFQTGALSIVAAPTGHGKTTFLLNLLLDAVERYPNRKHWFFSYEEDAAVVTLKALNAYVNAPLSANNRRTIESYYRTGTTKYFADEVAVNGTPMSAVDVFTGKAAEFWGLVEAGRLNIRQADWYAEDLTEAIRAVSRQTCGFVGLDYLGLLGRESRDRGTARHEELKGIALDLKNVAVETGVPIVAAVQFNREVVSPGRMAAHRLAESSDIERAANKVVGIWNGDKAAEPDKSEKPPEDRGIGPGTVYLSVLKARDERSDLAGVFDFDGNRGRIEHEGQTVGRGVKARGTGKKGDTAEVKQSAAESGSRGKYL